MFLKHKEALHDAPNWLANGLQYEVIMGSYAYGVHNKESDKDIYGWAFPPASYVFPHQVTGYIQGFGSKPQGFEQFQKCYSDVDFNIYGAIKYFQLCLENNPNMIDSLFVPDNCICFITDIGKYVRQNRHKFLCKKAWHTYKGYAYSQLKKLEIKNPIPGCKRYEIIKKYGYDTKFAYHIVRLIDYAEQIMLTGDLDLQRNREEWKFIREGGMSIEEIKKKFFEKEKELERHYETSKLPSKMREAEVKEILNHCLEENYGSMMNYINVQNENIKLKNMIYELKHVIKKYE